MDSYDKSCYICATTVKKETLLAYELFRARSTRIRCVWQTNPHLFQSAVFKVEIFVYAMPIQNHVDAKSGCFFSVTSQYRA